jgi:hypothetical protein
LLRFALLCRQEQRSFDEAMWLFSMAWTIKALSGWGMVQFKGMREPKKRWHPILSRQELRRWTYQAGLHHIAEPQLQQAEIAVCRAPRQPISNVLQGGLLRITAAERDRCRFWTTVAIDETREQRKERKRMEKLEKDRKAKAVRDEAARQSGKRKARSQYRADRAAQRKREAAFCQEHGIALRTLRLWKKKAAEGNSRCQSLVADIERSSTSIESPNIERPHFGNAGPGTNPQGRVLEPEPPVQPADLALPWPEGHTEAADEQSSRLEVEPRTDVSMLSPNHLQKLNEPESTVHSGSVKAYIQITSLRSSLRDFWPYKPRERRRPLMAEERQLRAEHNLTGYLMRKQRQASRKRCA